MSRQLFVRPVTMEDKAAILRISSRIWEGNDYVPLFFDRWVGEGGFWAGDVRGKVVAYGKATELSRGEWWLEGLRVDPDCRHRGIGKEMSRQVLYRTLEERPVSLRVATGDVNRESIHIITAVMGFKPCAEYRFFVGKPGRAGFHPNLTRPAAAEALEYLRSHEELTAGKGLLQSTWKFRQVNRNYLSELSRGEKIHGFRAGRRLEGLLILQPHGYRREDLDITFIGGTARALAAFRSFIFRAARECGTQTISGMAASDETAAILRSLGMKQHRHISKVLVYEYAI